MPLKERVKYLRNYRWSSYRGYAGLSREDEFVEYGPLLGLLRGRSKKEARKRYKEYVEVGIAETDEEFIKIKKNARHAIGSDEFAAWAGELYHKLVEKKDILEDVSFRQACVPLKVDDVLNVLAEKLCVDIAEFKQRKHGSPLRAIAGRALCRYSGLTQREAAKILEAGSGAGLSQQISGLSKRLVENKKLRGTLKKIETVLDEMRKLNS